MLRGAARLTGTEAIISQALLHELKPAPSLNQPASTITTSDVA